MDNPPNGPSKEDNGKILDFSISGARARHKGSTFVYRVGRGLYVNLTNRCVNVCKFCLRAFADTVGENDSLWLTREPYPEEVWDDLRRAGLRHYDEVVFCGFGEPTLRLDELLWIAERVKEEGGPPVRLNTCGQANLIYAEDVTPRFQGLVDVVSISLNAKNAVEYQAMCHPVFGIEAFDSILEFTRRIKQYVPRVILSVVDVLSEDDIEACRKIAEDCGVEFRLRTAEVDSEE